MEQQNGQQNKPREADIVPAALLPRTIDAFMGQHLNRIFGEAIVQLYVEDRKQIPGVELQIHNKPQGNYTEVTVKLLFRDQLIDEKKIFAI